MVTDVNILIDKVKCRLIERITNDEGKEIEKISSEFYSFGKEDIERQQKSKQKPKQSKPRPKEQKEAPKDGEKRPKRKRNRKRKKKPEAEKSNENRG